MQKGHFEIVRRRAEKLLARANALGLQKDGRPLVLDQALELIAAEEGFRNSHAMRADLVNRDVPALVQECPKEAGTDYAFAPGQTRAWVTAGSISVHLAMTDEGVVVDLYAKGAADESLASTYAFFSDAECEMLPSDDFDIDSVEEWAGSRWIEGMGAEGAKTRATLIREFIKVKNL